MRLLSVLVFFLASSDLAERWSKLPVTVITDFFTIRPGVSHRDDVLRIFKQPTRKEAANGNELLVYLGEQQIDGMKETRFTIAPATRKVERVVCIPMDDLDRQTVENTFGRECPPGAKRGSRCYVVKPGPAQRVYIEYEWQGVAFVFGPASAVEQIIYFPVKGDLLSIEYPSQRARPGGATAP